MKRIFDVGVAWLLLVVLWPVFVVIAVCIKANDGGPILYRGVRIGFGGRPFRMLKFRTMVVDADRLGGPSTSEDDPRITTIGGILRKYKLDELPQLINVLRGDMSFVGPRPEVESEVREYTARERELLNVRPGITDYASLRFHDEGEILKGSIDPHEAYRSLIRPEKMRLALKYVDNHSMRVDCAILIATVKTLVSSRVRRAE